MGLLGATVQLAAALALVVAATGKLARPRAFTATLQALDVPWTGPVRAAVVVAELGAAAALVTAPGAPTTQVAVVGLGAAFALVGVVAWARGEQVECACFGGGSGSPLGLRQVAALPLWLAVALVPAALGTLVDGRAGALLLTAAVLGACAVHLVAVAGLARENIGYRAVVGR